MAPLRHRRCLALRGARSETRAAALDHLSQWTERDILWIGDPNEQQRFAALSPARVVTALGRSLHAVVLDAHDGLDPDVLGQCHGLVWGGGALLLRLPPPGAGPSPATQASLAAYPHTPEEVGARFHVLLERALARAELATTLGPPPPLRDVSGHAEQAEVVARLVAAWSSPTPTRIALLADRGRGKSSALGLALRQLGGAR
ncbi:MAG: DUF1726 domain-containing protein [Myxococcales bacterium]|nr:DUF1726 domain-containing protein [Myxococcales bacterium]